MDTMEQTEVPTSPFAGPALSAGVASEAALDRFDSYYLPAASDARMPPRTCYVRPLGPCSRRGRCADAARRASK